jgi:hypothetical protein
MAKINAKTTGGGGVETIADSTGVLELQSAGTTMATISPSGFNLGSGTPSIATALSPYTGFKNRIINGAMMIAQRGTSFSFGTGGGTLYYGADRFRTFDFTWSAGSNITVSNDTTVFPTGFRNSYKWANGATGLTFNSGGYQQIEQLIEGFNIADCYTGNITISFWVRASTAGQYNICLTNNVASIERYSTRNYTINSANTWEQKTITVDLSAGIASGGTWNTGNGAGLALIFMLGANANRTGNTGLNTWAIGGSPNYDVQTTGSVNLATIANSTFFLTGVQLEKGTSATSFEYRDYGRELMMCQRYFEVVNARVNFTKHNTSVSSASMQFRVTKRSSPTIVTTTDTTITTTSANLDGVFYEKSDTNSGSVTKLTASSEL